MEGNSAIHFSRAAAVYDTRAGVQRAVAEKLARYLGGPAEADRILDLGCGTGFLTARLLDHYGQAVIDAVDISAAMIDHARRAVCGRDRVRWHVCDIWDFHPAGKYDLIGSSSALQWMQPLDALFRRLATFLKPGGRLLCSLMVEGTLEELHRLRREIAPHKAPPIRLPAIAETAGHLESAGFRLLRHGEEVFHVQYPSSEDLLRDLRETGLTGGPLSAASTLLTRGELSRLAERYRAVCGFRGGMREGRLRRLELRGVLPPFWNTRMNTTDHHRGDCPDFRGGNDVAKKKSFTAAKMGLSASAARGQAHFSALGPRRSAAIKEAEK